MAGRALRLPPRLLSEFDSVVLQMFESVDNANSRCASRARNFASSTIELIWLLLNHRFEAGRLAEVASKLVDQIAELKRLYRHRRNSRRPLFRIPVEMLTASLSFLSVKDQLSIMRVSQHLRWHVIETPSLWSYVDHIQNTTALSFVLELAKNIPVDITNLSIGHQNDVRFETVAAHMHHIRTLDLHLNLVILNNYTFNMPSRAYTALTTTAPVLRLLSFCADRGVGSNGRPQINSNFSISEKTMPRLSSLQLHGVEMSVNMCRLIQSLRTFSFSFHGRSQFGSASLEQSASQHLRNLTSLNIALGGWNAAQPYPYFGPSVKQVNIRWTRPGLFVPRDAVPDHVAWNSIRTVHVAHMCGSSANPPADTTPLTGFAIPGTTAPYQTLSLRTSGAPDTRVHARAIDSDGRERVFCGLHPSTVEGLVALIPGEELSSITIAATAVALRALSDARFPVLSCIRLVLDTSDISWIDSFARDMPNIKTLERLELSQEAYCTAPKWTTAIIIKR